MQKFAREIRKGLAAGGLLALLAAHGAFGQSTQPAATRPGGAGESASAILMGLQVPGVTPGMSIESLLQLGGTALREQQVSQAERIFAAILQEDPRNAPAMMMLAGVYEINSHQARKSSDPAVSGRADELSEAAVKWYVAASTLFAEAGDHVQAGRGFQRVLSFQPRHALAQLGLARVTAAAGQDVSAIELFKNYLKNPSAPPDTLAQANLELARIYRRSRFPAQALDCLTTALSRDRENPETYLEIARTHMDKAQLAEARTNAETAIKKAPSNPEYHMVLAQILMAQGELAPAADSALRAIALARQQQRNQPDNQTLLRSLASYYGVYGQVLQQILAKDSGSTLARIHLARAIQEQAAVAEALAMYQALDLLRRAPADDRRNPRLLEVTLEVLIHLNLADEAVLLAGQLARVEPGNQLAQRVLQQTASAAIPATQSSR